MGLSGEPRSPAFAVGALGSGSQTGGGTVAAGAAAVGAAAVGATVAAATVGAVVGATAVAGEQAPTSMATSARLANITYGDRALRVILLSFFLDSEMGSYPDHNPLYSLNQYQALPKFSAPQS
jgi:hypothetical protein